MNHHRKIWTLGTIMTWIVAFWSGSLPSAFGQEPLQKLLVEDELVVIDKEGDIVGQVVNADATTAVVAFKRAGFPLFLLTLEKNGFVSRTAVYFADADCQGPVVYLLPSALLLPSAGIIGTKAYLRAPNNSPQKVAPLFRWQQGECSPVSSRRVVPAQEVLDLATEFRPPFRVVIHSLGLTTDRSNIALGTNALSKNDTGINNIAIGSVAGADLTSGDNNIYLGNRGATSESGVIWIGTLGRHTSTFLAGNVFANGGIDVVGNLTLPNSSTASGNILKGGQLFMHNFGFSNTFLGHSAGNLTMTGGENTAVGRFVLPSNTTGNHNTAVGSSALASNTTGRTNTALGHAALVNNTAGRTNTALGHAALLNTIGNDNIAIGTYAGENLTSGSHNIYIGNRGQQESSTIRIGTPLLQVQTLLVGNVGIGTESPGAKLHVAGNVLATGSITISDARLKANILPLTDVLEKLAQLRGVSFTWNDESAALTGRAAGQQDIGVIAQEVEAVYPELVTTWAEGGYKAVDYGKLAGIPIEAVKVVKVEKEEHQQRLVALEARVAVLEEAVTAHASASTELN